MPNIIITRTGACPRSIRKWVFKGLRISRGRATAIRKVSGAHWMNKPENINNPPEVAEPDSPIAPGFLHYAPQSVQQSLTRKSFRR